MKRIWMFGVVLWSVLFVMSVMTVTPKGEFSGELPEGSDNAGDVVAAAAVKGTSTSAKPFVSATQTSGTTASGRMTTAAVLSDETSLVDEAHVVRVKDGDTVLTLPLDTYLTGVLAAEMPGAFPMEALKAQAVAARTFVLRREAEHQTGGKKNHGEAVICTDPGCCMGYRDLETDAVEVFGANAAEYQGKMYQAVSETDGVILTYDDVPILAAFHAISGGRTESAKDVWGSDVPYLVSVESPGEENAAKFHGAVTVGAEIFRTCFQEAYPSAKFLDDPMTWFADPVRGDGGGLKTVTVGGVKVTGAVLRSMLGLDSTDFTVTVGVDDVGGVILTFHTTGYGHGVGMSQYGALAMAQKGSGYEDILARYYPGAVLTGMEQTA